MESKITLKSTKNQILEAYEQLLKKQQEKKTEEPKKVQEQQQKAGLTQKAASMSNEIIVKGIADLKVSVSKSLDELGSKFVTEYKKFEELQQAISIEKQNLEDLYGLSVNTDSLATMLLAQKEQKEKFEQEMQSRREELQEKIKNEKEQFENTMSEKRANWKKEQEEQAATKKEYETLLKKNRAREEEEYSYNHKITRKKEEDVYIEKKQLLEKELATKKADFEQDIASRMSKLEEAEAELDELREKGKAFPSELEKAVAKAINETTGKLETQHRFETELKAKEVDGELKLKDQVIASLNNKIKEMENSIKEMSGKTITAEASVKDIALKAIESSSKQPYIIEKTNDKKQE